MEINVYDDLKKGDKLKKGDRFYNTGKDMLIDISRLLIGSLVDGHNIKYQRLRIDKKCWKLRNRKLVFHFIFVGWDCLSFGLHTCFSQPNIEIHLPFGFLRIGWFGEYYKVKN